MREFEGVVVKEFRGSYNLISLRSPFNRHFGY